MRRFTPLVLALTLVAAACASGSDNGSESAAASSTTITIMMTTTSNVTTTTTVPPSTTTMAPTTTTTTTTTVLVPVFLSKEGTITTGPSASDPVFNIPHDVTTFADLEPITRSSLRNTGDQGYIFVRADGLRQGEIHRLWPPGKALDVIWLTSAVGSPPFTVFDALTLEGELDQFGLHVDCRTPEGDVGAALLSFGGGTPEPLIAWGIDRETMSFVPLDVVEGVELGECLDIEPRE